MFQKKKILLKYMEIGFFKEKSRLNLKINSLFLDFKDMSINSILEELCIEPLVI